MADTRPGALQLRQRSANVVDHHYDDAKPGKPLYLLIPGGLVALASLALIIFIAYRAFLDGTMDQGQGITLMLILAPFYIGGVFLFAYGYELYDLGKALRDTAIVVFITLASVVIIAVLFLVLGEMGGSKSSSSSSSSSSKSSGSSGSSSSKGGVVDGVANAVGGVFTGGTNTVSSGSYSPPSGGYGPNLAGPLFVNLGSHEVTREVTHEVVHEVPVAPPKPVAVKCPACGRAYIPSETKFACPNCGAPASKEMIAESNKGIPPEDLKPVDPSASAAST
ncbi:MAG: hypothetical protein WCF84_14885 [Anaerolineae bacterium]